MASWRWVRPVLTIGQSSSAFASRAAAGSSRAGRSVSSIAMAADELERGRDRVVRGLAAVDVVVGVDSPGPRPGGAAGELGDDLVHVRVRRGARAGLVDVDRELVVVAAVGDLGGRRARSRRRRAGSSRPSSPFVSAAACLIEGERPDERPREALAGDREVEDRPLGRGAVQGVGRARPSRPSSRVRCGSAPGSSRVRSSSCSDCRRAGRSAWPGRHDDRDRLARLRALGTEGARSADDPGQRPRHRL